MKKVILNWILVFGWMAVIYYFSNQPNLKSELAPIWDTFFRKIAHISEFFILAYFLFNAFRSTGVKFNQALMMSFIVAVMYAFSDEFHQGQVLGRHSSYKDVAIDSFGALAFVFLRFKLRNKY